MAFSPETYALLKGIATDAAASATTASDAADTATGAAEQAAASAAAAAANSGLAPAFDSTATYAVGDLVLYDGAVYRFTAAHTGAWDAGDVEQTTLGEELESVNEALTTKANVDGSYDGMTVGNAEQLVSTVMTEDKAPYVFRTSGGSADIGNREYDTLIGGTVAFNQLVINPSSVGGIGWSKLGADIASPTADGYVKITRSAGNNTAEVYRNIGVIYRHKYLFVYDAYFVAGSSGEALIYPRTNDGNLTPYQIPTVKGTLTSFIFTPTAAQTQINARFYIYGTGNEIYVKSVNCFDLTLMFGTTIADYIYSLETATPGAGVAYFRKLFPKPYYPYNAGTLIHVNASAHKTVGFNQWDEEWELGGYSSTDGSKTAGTSTIRSKNKIRVFPGTQYYFQMPQGAWVFCYDANETLILNVENPGSGIKNYLTVSEPTQKTLPANCEYIAFQCFTDYGTTYKNDICINLSWSGTRNGEYEPYSAHTYPLDSDLVLRGIPKLDASNNLYYDGDTYEADGTVTRRYGIVDLGTLTWGYIADYGNYFQAEIPSGSLAKTNTTNAICSYPYTPRAYWITSDKWLAEDKIISIAVASQNFRLKDSSKSASDLTNGHASWLDGVYLVYELATPTPESADPFASPQIVDDWGTEEYVVTEQNGVAMPVGHDTLYPQNLRDKLQHLPNLAPADGKYVVQQSGTQMSLVPAPSELPAAPSEDGTYSLKCTVASGTASYSWVADA